MANGKIQSGVSDKDLPALLKTHSYLNLVDFATNQPFDVNTITTKIEMHQKKLADIRKPESANWDRVIWELDQDPIIADAQAQIIVETLATEKFEYTSESKTYKILGDKQVGFTQHNDFTGNHLHTISSQYAKNSDTKYEKAPLTDSVVQGTYRDIINKKLEANNLPLLSYLARDTDFSKKIDNASVPQKDTAQKLIKGLIDVDTLIKNVKPVEHNIIATALTQEKAEFDLLVKQIEEKQAKIQNLEQASKVSSLYNALADELPKIKQELDDVKAKNTALETEKQELINTKAFEIQEAIAEITQEKAKIKEALDEANKTIADNKTDYENLEETNKRIESEKKALEEEKALFEKQKQEWASEKKILLESLENSNLTNTTIKSQLEATQTELTGLNRVKENLETSQAQLLAQETEIVGLKAQLEAITKTIKEEVAKQVEDGIKFWRAEAIKFKEMFLLSGKVLKNEQATKDKLKAEVDKSKTKRASTKKTVSPKVDIQKGIQDEFRKMNEQKKLNNLDDDGNTPNPDTPKNK